MKKLFSVLLSLCLLLTCSVCVFAAGDAEDATVAVGDSIVFGRYEQDNDPENGPEDIEWIVLDVRDGQALLISRFLLDCVPYQEDFSDTTWENCSLRKWLNDTFLNTAFTEDEQTVIAEETVPADENPSYDTDTGNDMTDKIFLLSVSEADEYFNSKEARACTATEYAAVQGATGGAENWWWLRTPGSSSQYAVMVSDSGAISSNGCMNAGNEKITLTADQIAELSVPVVDSKVTVKIDGEDMVLTVNEDGTGTGFNNQVAVRPVLWLMLDDQNDLFTVLSGSGEDAVQGDWEEEQYFEEDEEGYVEEYDEDGYLVHSEEPYYVDGIQVGTLCYDAVIPCSFLDETYNTTSLWILPVIGPEEPIERCLSFTLNMMYFSMDDPKGLGLQNIYCRENGTFQKVGYLDMPNLFENYTMDFEFENPTKIDGFALMAYTPSQPGAFSLGCSLSDVYYIK